MSRPKIHEAGLNQHDEGHNDFKKTTTFSVIPRAEVIVPKIPLLQP